MKYNPNLHNRHSIRLRGWNYTNTGMYFVTICLNQRIPKKIKYNAKMGQSFAKIGQSFAKIGQPRGVAPTVTDKKFDFPTFGTIENDIMILNDPGKMIQQIWNEMPEHYSGIEIDEFIVMPDHIHGIIIVGATPRGCPFENHIRTIENHTRPIENHPHPVAISLSYILDCFKTMTTTRYIQGVKQQNWQIFNKKLWQRNYYEHIIRNETEYINIVNYIRNNPISWKKNY